MQTFNQYISEASYTPTKSDLDLMKNVEAEFNKLFPNGHVFTDTRKTIGRPYIIVSIGMIKDAKDAPSGYRDNDPMMHKYMVDIKGENDYELTLLQGSGISTNPEAGSYLAMGRHKVPFRKSKGDSKRILTTFKRHFSRLREGLNKVSHNVYGATRMDPKYLK